MRFRLIILTTLMLGCSIVHAPEVDMKTIGRAESKYCEYVYTNAELVSARCIETKSDAFSGWVVVGEIFNGIASGVVKILTLGIM